MKNLILILSLVFLPLFNLNAQDTVSFEIVKLEKHNFNVKKFEKELIRQMEINFPGMTLDTSIAYACRATTQKEAGYPICYGTKKGGMVNTSTNEKKEAERLVLEYKKYLTDVLYIDEKAITRCGFTEFCATATLQYGGLVRYGIIIDNNITREQIMEEGNIIGSN